MSRTSKVKWIEDVERHGDAVNLMKEPGDCVIVERGYPRNLVFMCPDGCGEIITINLDPASGPAWRFYKRKNGYTLYPSVALTSGCHSHFILWNDEIVWCDRKGSHKPISIDKDLLMAITEKLPKTRTHFAVLAEQLEGVPWDVLRGCHELVRLGLAKEQGKGFFCRAKENG